MEEVVLRNMYHFSSELYEDDDAATMGSSFIIVVSGCVNVVFVGPARPRVNRY